MKIDDFDFGKYVTITVCNDSKTSWFRVRGLCTSRTLRPLVNKILEMGTGILHCRDFPPKSA